MAVVSVEVSDKIAKKFVPYSVVALEDFGDVVFNDDWTEISGDNENAYFEAQKDLANGETFGMDDLRKIISSKKKGEICIK